MDFDLVIDIIFESLLSHILNSNSIRVLVLLEIQKHKVKSLLQCEAFGNF